MKLEKWFRIFTPILLFLIVWVIGFIYFSLQKGEAAAWALVPFFYSFPFVILLFVFDIIFKMLRSLKVFIIWIIELLLIFLFCFLSFLYIN